MSSVLSSLPPRGGARARRNKLLSDVTGRHYNAGNSDVLFARAPPLGGKEERTDDISDYVFLFEISFFVLEIFRFLYYANKESDDVINRSTKR